MRERGRAQQQQQKHNQYILLTVCNEISASHSKNSKLETETINRHTFSVQSINTRKNIIKQNVNRTSYRTPLK